MTTVLRAISSTLAALVRWSGLAIRESFFGVHRFDDFSRRLGIATNILAQRLDYFAHWPHVKGLVPHHNVYNFTRFQDVWRDK